MARGQSSLKRLSETEARELIEGMRWANGKFCPHCGNCEQDRIVTLESKKDNAVRAGLYRCMECRKQFTVTVGTIFERSKVPLADWVYAFAAMCASKKGISAHQIHRELGVTYKTAWFMCHRIRYAMETGDVSKLEGIVTADETGIGGKPRNPGESKPKMAVITLVEKGGRARSKVTTSVTALNLRKHLTKNIDPKATLMTDELPAYRAIGKHFAAHKTVRHSTREYVGKEGQHSNDAESYFATLKRGIYGTFHHVSPQHLHRFVTEFDFRWSNRDVSDTERTLRAIAQVDGKRLTYRRTVDVKSVN